MSSRREYFGAPRKLKSGRWQARYTDPRGVMVSAGTYTTKTEARKVLNRIQVNLEQGSHRDPRSGRITLGAWARPWLAVHKVHVAPSTANSYDSVLETLILAREVDGRDIGLAAMPLQSITPMVVAQWQAGLVKAGLSPRRCVYGLRLLSMTLKAAVREGLIMANPCDHAKRPRLPEPDPTILRPEDVARLVAAMPAPYGLLVDVLAYGGLRLGEARGLRRRDLDPLRCRLLVSSAILELGGRFQRGDTKTHQMRNVPLPASLVRDLELHLATLPADPDTLIFQSRTGGPLRDKAIRSVLAKACEATGLQITPHGFRASCASWVAETDGVLEAARRLGHATTSITTRHYARPATGGDVRVAQRLDDMRRAAEGSNEATAALAAT